MLSGKVLKADSKQTSQGKAYKRLQIETENGSRWYSAFENPAVSDGDIVEFESVKNGDFWNALAVKKTGSSGQPKVTEERVGSMTNDRSKEIRYLALLKVGAICVARNAETQKVVITPQDLVKFTNDLEKEAFGDD